MKLDPVQGSSVIKAQGYDPATGKLRVELHSGKTYEYTDVSVDKYAAFTGAASPGAFWNAKIKSGHPHREIPKAHPPSRS